MMLCTFASAISNTALALRKRARRVRTESWQGLSTANKPEMDTYELRHVFLQCSMPTEELLYYRQSIGPNLPWADEHFEKERVSGEPLNPGQTWRQWPYAHSADKFRTWNVHKTLGERQFNHTYAERYWPKTAGLFPNGKCPCPEAHTEEYQYCDYCRPSVDNTNRGIRYLYGDLRDVVRQLAREPHTRQAVLPVFFPEDTGAVHGDRVPCSLSYQFLVRPDVTGKEFIDISYTIRSCDWSRHFRDDVYLTVRLVLWVLQELRKIDSRWNSVEPGVFIMLITSLHLFVNDYNAEFGPRGDDVW